MSCFCEEGTKGGGSLFQREGAALRKDLSVNLSQEVSIRIGQTKDSLRSVWDERVEY